MEIFGINLLQYLVLFVSMLVVYFIMHDAEIKETAIAFSELIQLIEHWIDSPEDVSFAQQSKDVNDYLTTLWKKEGIRFTLVRADGAVLLDSAVEDNNEMDNHLSRPEIQDALVYGRGITIRHSQTLDKNMIYVAEPYKTKWGTLYFRLAASPNIINHNQLIIAILIIMAVTGVLLIKLC